MALVPCPDCAREVSSEAPACPGCGRPMKSEPPPVAVPPPGVAPIASPSMDPETEALLRACDFQLARWAIAAFFHAAISEAAYKGGQVAFKTEFVTGWETFEENPCRDTAAEWLTQAPDHAPIILKYFKLCSPGGLFASWQSILHPSSADPDQRAKAIRELLGKFPPPPE
jgi:hypothetical protein